ncbi:hypothetical protein [Paractinoplanes globisporus]|uniref:Uncharacterized protein n=1 Tax=Paractinoplanes globisporus TaxID=113565 RepID=A0ABW6WKJ1_9ACTN|nr:hypothetical protein [Actinoplanes globisporus]
MSSIVALVGVWIGGRLSFRTQEKGWKEAESQRWHDLRQATYGDFLAAARRYRTYVGRSETRFELTPYADGTRLSPRFDEQGTVHKQALDAALAQVQFVAQYQQTASAARTLVGMADRTAVAKTVYGSKMVPARIDDLFWDSEMEFVNAIRAELGLMPLVRDIYDGPRKTVDCELFDAYRATQKQSLKDLGGDPA